jgi:hypothetical protein
MHSTNGVPFKYILTDFTQKNIDFWKSHPSFQPLLERGLIDFALFNAESDDSLSLQVSGSVLSAETISNPIIAICNYVFDTLSAVRGAHVEIGSAWLSFLLLFLLPCAAGTAVVAVASYCNCWSAGCLPATGCFSRDRGSASPHDAVSDVHHGADGHE